MWEEQIGTLEETKSYKMSFMTLQEYKGEKYLSTAKDKSQIKPVDDVDIGSSIQEDINDKNKTAEYNSGVVIAVVSFDKYPGCLKCGSKVNIQDADYFGVCSKCDAWQRVDKCPEHYVAQLMIETNDCQGIQQGHY